MPDLVKADIFFFIATVALLVITVVGVWAAVYLIRILRDVQEVTRIFKTESERVAQDISELRTNLKTKGSVFTGLARFFRHVFNRNAKGRK